MRDDVRMASLRLTLRARRAATSTPTSASRVASCLACATAAAALGGAVDSMLLPDGCCRGEHGARDGLGHIRCLRRAFGVVALHLVHGSAPASCATSASTRRGLRARASRICKASLVTHPASPIKPESHQRAAACARLSAAHRRACRRPMRLRTHEHARPCRPRPACLCTGWLLPSGTLEECSSHDLSR